MRTTVNGRARPAAGLITGLALAALLAACASQPSVTGPPGMGRPLPGLLPGEERVTYRCDNGTEVTMRFFPTSGQANLWQEGVQTTLTGQDVPGGRSYSAGATSANVSADRTSMTLRVGMAAETQCRAVGTPPRPPGPVPPPPPPPPGQPMPPPAESRGTFRCDNGETVVLRSFPQQGVAVLERGGQSVELQQQRVASGFEYSNGQTSVRGKGMTEFTLTVGNMAPTQCRIL